MNHTTQTIRAYGDKIASAIEKACESPVKYSLNDVGCYVDGARGIYAIDAIVNLAIDHGFKLGMTDEERPWSFFDYEFRDEIEDSAESFMNDKFNVDGTYWGRNESGDWGLWEIDDYSQHSVN